MAEHRRRRSFSPPVNQCLKRPHLEELGSGRKAADPEQQPDNKIYSGKEVVVFAGLGRMEKSSNAATKRLFTLGLGFPGRKTYKVLKAERKQRVRKLAVLLPKKEKLALAKVKAGNKLAFAKVKAEKKLAFAKVKAEKKLALAKVKAEKKLEESEAEKKLEESESEKKLEESEAEESAVSSLEEEDVFSGSEDYESNEDEQSEAFCARLNQNPHPDELPYNLSLQEAAVRFACDRPGVLVPYNEELNMYYPALSEMPEEYPEHTLPKLRDPEYDLPRLRKYYKKFKRGLHYVGHFRVPVPKGGSVEKEMKEEFPGEVAHSLYMVWGDYGFEDFIERATVVTTKPRDLETVDEADYDGPLPAPIACY